MYKKSLVGMTVLICFAFLFISCTKEDGITGNPTVKILHLGTHASPDDRYFYTGIPIHIDAKITAPGIVKKIELEVLQKTGYGNFNIKQVYTDPYAGQTEIASFYEHPDVAADFPIGEYLFLLRVTDQAGLVGTARADVTIKPGEGHEGGHNHD
jgi:hypothetical protein